MLDVEIVGRNEPPIPLDLISYAQNLQITTNQQYESAGTNLALCRTTEKTIKAYWNPMIKDADAVADSLRAKRDEMLKRVKTIEAPIEAEIARYDKWLKEQKALAAAKAIDAYHKEQEKAKAKADELVAKGKVEQAAEVLQNVKVPEPKPIATPEKTGTSVVVLYDFEITNPEEVPREYCKPDESKIIKVISAFKGKIEIKGVRIFSKESVRQKAYDNRIKDAY